MQQKFIRSHFVCIGHAMYSQIFCIKASEIPKSYVIIEKRQKTDINFVVY